jgi:chromosome segregation ATPase
MMKMSLSVAGGSLKISFAQNRDLQQETSMAENTPNNQPSVSESLIRIENALMAFIASQQQVSSQILSRLDSVDADMRSVKTRLDSIESDLSALKVEVAEIKEDAKLRYVDLRERIDLTRDKLGVMQRELNEFIKDLTKPPFASTPTR